jgi:alginate O-acetyltransferase complex protein AlgI
MLFIPLGGNRRGRARTYLNLMLTMLLGGLWHGASWTFVVWGGRHGSCLAIEPALSVDAGATLGRAARLVRVVLTFHLVCLAWVFFRAQSFERAWQYLRGLARTGLWFTREELSNVLPTGIVVLGCFALAPLRQLIVRWDPGPRLSKQFLLGVTLGLAMVVLMVVGATSQRSIYFQF